jgi:RimJ/RimL family protein N-acetyltransferase
MSQDATVKILETERLVLRQLCADDAEFIHQLVNEPAWLRYVGDKGVATVEDARDYILKGPVKMYTDAGFGLWLVERKDDRIPIGICGLIKRDSLADVDLGFAFLSVHRRQGHAFEAASATLSYAKKVLGLEKVIAIMSPDNDASARLLEKLGFHFERMTQLSDNGPELKIYTVSV